MVEWKVLLFYLLLCLSLNVGPHEDILVAEFVDRDARLGPDDGVDAAHLVANFPRALKTPSEKEFLSILKLNIRCARSIVLCMY
jgi:hypothetical protein